MQNTKLFVGGLSWDTTEATLQEYFAKVGEVEEVKIIFDRNTGRSKGFGFVTMKTAEGAQKAMAELNDTELDGRKIAVNEARPQKPKFDN